MRTKRSGDAAPSGLDSRKSLATWLLTSALVVPAIFVVPDDSFAQSAAPSQLPAVVVEQPVVRRSVAPPQRAARRASTGRTRSPQQRAAQSAPPAPATAFVRGTDPVRGFVPGVSASAMKTDTSLLETPQSVSVISRDNLDARGVETIVEALQYTAGVATQTGGKDPRFDFFRIRGFEAGNYRDGLRDNSNGTFAVFRNEPYGAQRVDVVKGPSSVLYGSNGPGGLIDIISKRPTRETFGEVVGLVGTADRLQGAFDVGGPVSTAKDNSLFYRLTGVLRDSEAQIAKFSDKTKDDRAYIAPAVTWQPNANTTLTLLSDYQHDRTDNAFPVSVVTLRGANVASVKPLPFYMGDPSFNKFEQDQYRIGYQFEHRFSDDLIVRSKARFGHIDLEYRYLTLNPAALPLSTLTAYPRVARQVNESSDSFSLDNNVAVKLATGPLQHTVLVGTDYQSFGLQSVQRNGAAPSLNLITPAYGLAIPTPTAPIASTVQDTTQVGVYLQDQIKLQRWILTLGGRFDAADQTTTNRLTGTPQSSDDTAFTKRAGLAYEFDNGVVPYVSYSESFLPTTGTDFFGVAFQPTTSKQYEGGVKFQPNRDILVTMAAFDLTQKNVLTGDAGAGRQGYSVQTGAINSRGFEFEMLAKLLPGLNIIGTYTLQDLTITESNNGDVGYRPLQVPKILASGYADYTFENGPLTGFGFGAGARFNGESFADKTNTISNPAYTVFDAGIHYRMEKGINLALNVKNIADKDTYTCTTTGGCYYISPRIVTATASYRW